MDNFEKIPHPLQTESGVVNNKDTEQKVSLLDKKVEQLLRTAQSQAINHSELDALFKKKIQMLSRTPAKFLENLDEFVKLDAEIEKHVILVKTLTEYRMLIQKTGADLYTVNDTLAHENAHANVAESLDAKFKGYAIVVSKDKGDFVYQPYADYEIPPTWDLKKQIEVNIKIAEAPKSYGNKLAPDDAERIVELRKQLHNQFPQD